MFCEITDPVLICDLVASHFNFTPMDEKKDKEYMSQTQIF